MNRIWLAPLSDTLYRESPRRVTSPTCRKLTRRETSGARNHSAHQSKSRNGRRPRASRRFQELEGRLSLDGSNVFSAWTFGSTALCVRNSLTFLKFFECDALEIRHVEEHILARSGVNESEAPVCNSFDRAFCHSSQPSEKVVLKRNSARMASDSVGYERFVNRKIAASFKPRPSMPSAAESRRRFEPAGL